VRITVQDDGIGMSEEARAHAFEPFYSTKPFGKGTGLGLAVVHGIVRQCGGSVEIQSQEGHGTTVTMQFPAATGTAVAGSVAPTQPTPGAERILVVEDDDAVRRLVCATLEMLGYRVLQAVDGPSALALFDAAEPGIRVLLTDAIMPGMNGREVAAALRARDPALAVIFMSGYTDDRLLHRGVIDGQDNYLQKPFSVAELTALIRRVVAGSSPAGDPTHPAITAPPATG
jgi:CheY-like chemotaxis protein